jgi:hypothetical protein
MRQQWRSARPRNGGLHPILPQFWNSHSHESTSMATWVLINRVIIRILSSQRVRNDPIKA